MAQELPKDFVDFETALRRSAQETSNVIGRVTDILPPRPSRGTDWQSKLELAELDTFGSQAVKWFKPNPSDHPQVTGTGDIVVLWNMRSSEWSGMKFLLSSHGSTWLVFHQKDIPEKADLTQLQLKYVKEKRAQKPTPEIMRYAFALCNAGPRDLYTEPVTQLPTPDETIGTLDVGTGPRDKFSLIKDVKADKFYHIIAQVVKLFSTRSCLEIFVTDYTSNSLLFNHDKGSKGKAGVVRDGDEYGYAGRMAKKGDFNWPGPLGTRTLTVTLWPPHSYWASTNVKVNDTVFLRNTRIKVSTLGTLEGVMHTDKKYEDRIDISVLSIDKDADQRVKDLFRRKKDYEKQMKEEMNGSGEEVNGLKRQGDNSSEPLSKAQKKKKRKQEQLEKAKLGANGEPQEKEMAKPETDDKSKVEYPISGVAAIRAAKNELNRNIKSQLPNHPTRTVSDILDTSKTHLHFPPSGDSFVLPFMNIKFKANLRILDFFPHNLEDFTFRFKIPEKTPLSDDEDDDPDSGSDISSGAETPPPPSSAADREDREWRWEWQFYLLCEDIKPTHPKERIKLCITKEDAVFLLGLDACNLRKNPRIVYQLREKLFILWGDLEERKRYSQSLGLTIWHPPEAFKEMNQRKGIPNGWGEWDRPKSKPFNCCIAEYGKKNKNNKEALGGWERRFRMFGTTIS